MKYRITKQYEITGRAYYVAQYLNEKSGLWEYLSETEVYNGLMMGEHPRHFRSAGAALRALKAKKRQLDNARRDAEVEVGVIL